MYSWDAEGPPHVLNTDQDALYFKKKIIENQTWGELGPKTIVFAQALDIKLFSMPIYAVQNDFTYWNSFPQELFDLVFGFASRLRDIWPMWYKGTAISVLQDQRKKSSKIFATRDKRKQKNMM